MDTLLSATQVIVSGAALGAGLTGGKHRPASGPTRAASEAFDVECFGSEIAGTNRFVGVLLTVTGSGIDAARTDGLRRAAGERTVRQGNRATLFRSSCAARRQI
jgi:hypothetical protein